MPTQQTVYIVVPTLQLLTISLAKKLFFKTPLDSGDITSLQSNSTFLFKHHLTGEAWPACRAILPLHSNTTWQARHLLIQTPLDRRAGAAPWSVPTQQTVYVVAPTSQLLTINLFFQGEAWPACRAILSFHSNTTWQARHGQLAEQLYLFIQTPCRANLPFNSNTTRQARHGQLAEQFYLFIQTPLDSCRRGINILGGAGMVSVDHTSTLAKNLRPGNSRFARLATHWCVWTRGLRMHALAMSSLQCYEWKDGR